MVGFKKLVALVLVLLLVFSFTSSLAEDKIKVGIAQLVTHVALDSARDGFIKALNDNGFTDENVEFDIQNAQGEIANLSTIADRFISNNVDLILGIATSSVQTMAGKTADIPILGTAVTDYEVARLVFSNEKPDCNVSGTSDMNPIKDQIALLQSLCPNAKKVGVIFSSNEDNSILQAKLAKQAIEEMGMTYVEATVTSTNDVQQTVQDLVTRCDVLYLPTDNVISSSMPIVHGVLLENKMPSICGEGAMLQNGGLATLGINYFDLGFQTGMMAVRILKGEQKIEEMPIEFSTGFEYEINQTVAEEIGFEVPEDWKQYLKAF